MSSDSENETPKTRTPRLGWGVRFAIAVTGAVVSWWLSFSLLNNLYLPGVSTLGERLWQMSPFILGQLIAISFTGWATFLFFGGLSRLGKWGTLLGIMLGLPFSIFVSNALLNDWFNGGHSGLLRWLFWIAPVALILLYPLPIMWMKRRAVASVNRGDYERALKISRIWLRSKVYGPPFQGWIMLQAGRYTEARALLKGGAFDEKGLPLLTSHNFYFYVLTSMNQENYTEAQELLEAANRVPQKGDHFQFALAECLLSSNKDPERARELIDQVISNLKKKYKPVRDRMHMAQCTALHAWALAACGQFEQAESGLREAFADSAALNPPDLAGLLQLKGSTWRALGKPELAREAFQHAMAICPYGSNAMFSQQNLALTGETSDE
jgi:tetratricopeptide (TPR) repeat protein